jgi:hypothetical protein
MFISDNGIWTRRGATATTWAAWKLMGANFREEGYTAAAEARITRVPNDYKSGTTISQIPNTGGLASAPGPTGSSAGLLETVKVVDNFFVKQTFTAIPGGNKYERVSSSSDGLTWTGAWKSVTLT